MGSWGLVVNSVQCTHCTVHCTPKNTNLCMDEKTNTKKTQDYEYVIFCAPVIYDVSDV